MSSLQAVDYSLEYKQSKPDWQNKRKLLNSDFTTLEFEVGKTVNQRVERWTKKNAGSQSVFNQNIQMVHKIHLAEGLNLEQRFIMGLGSEEKWIEGTVEDDRLERVTQTHRSQLTIEPVKWSTFTFQNEMRFEQRDDRENASFRRVSRAGARFQFAKNLTLSPYVRQQFDINDRGVELNRDKFGIGASYTVSKYTQLSPFVTRENLTYENGNMAMSDEIGVTISQQIYKKYLSGKFTPRYTNQTRDWDPDFEQNIQTVDASILWAPMPGLVINAGNRFRNRQNEKDNSNQLEQRLYSQVTHRPIKEIQFRFRSEYSLTENTRPVDEFDDSTSRMNVMFRPELKINENFSTGAEVHYRYHDRGNASASAPESEQVFLVSLIGQF
ncbi:MAG: hypothetical protein AAFY98_07665 [Verrucomicrobiota bacterium]